jgi:hypothetical protein
VTEPVTQVHIESEILRLCRRAEQVTHDLADRARDAAEADVAYKVAHARALLRAQGPQYVRDATAVAECEELYDHRRTTEALLLAAQEAGRNVRAQLDSLRSVNSNLRAAISHATGVGS